MRGLKIFLVALLLSSGVDIYQTSHSRFLVRNGFKAFIMAKATVEEDGEVMREYYFTDTSGKEIIITHPSRKMNYVNELIYYGKHVYYDPKNSTDYTVYPKSASSFISFLTTFLVYFVFVTLLLAVVRNAKRLFLYIRRKTLLFVP